MTLTLVATPGDAAANSYVSLADAELYVAARPFSSAWTSVTNDESKKQALLFATRLLDREAWAGAKGMTPAGALTQALAFPRRWAPTLEFDAGGHVITEVFIDLSTAYYDATTIPQPIVAATCELALLILAAGTVDPFTQDALRVKRERVDVIETEYFASQDWIRGLGRFPHVVRLVAHLLRSGSGREVQRV